jgi:hypothetical protein
MPYVFPLVFGADTAPLPYELPFIVGADQVRDLPYELPFLLYPV